MGNFRDIKAQAAKSQRGKYNAGGHCAYANGGRTRKPGVVINVISGQPPQQPPVMQPGPMGPPPTPMPPAGMNGPAGPGGPLPPPIKNQAMQAMGGPPGMFAKGGAVRGKLPPSGAVGKMPAMAGSGSGVGRLERNQNPNKKA
jgi:hypothetical protein